MSKGFSMITGASSGMGEATAVLLSHSRNLILHGRDEERLAAVAEICKKNGREILVFPFDLEQCDRLAEALRRLLSEKRVNVDEFVHFAGMTEVLPMSKTTYSVGLKVMNVNYFSATEMISTLLKRKANGDSLRKIILTSSIVAQTGKRYQPHYCASKSAINALGKTLAYELAPTVRVNVIAPGSFRTRITETLFYDPKAEWNPPTLLPPGAPIEVAKMVRFLLSDDAEYLTGQIIAVDGGESIPRL
jgi:NAD(P)-dependent dehydrogenase (short-subunit alcohol dehydrogenase family)